MPLFATDYNCIDTHHGNKDTLFFFIYEIMYHPIRNANKMNPGTFILYILECLFEVLSIHSIPAYIAFM